MANAFWGTLIAAFLGAFFASWLWHWMGNNWEDWTALVKVVAYLLFAGAAMSILIFWLLRHGF
jgi:hypothetical protein